jgi:spermidine synthase
VTPTIGAAVAGNLIAAGAAWVVLRRWRRTDQPIPLGAPPARQAAREISKGGRPFWVAATLAVSGAAALVDEVVWSRALGLIIGSSVYAFTAMLTTFLIGLAAGAAAGVWLMRRMRGRLVVLGAVQIAIAAAGLATVALLAQLPFALVWAAGALRAIGPWSVPLAQFALSFLVMWLPTFGFGLVFPIALHLLVAGPDTAGRAVGRLYAINTAGAIAGAFLAGFVLLPVVGVQGTLFLAVGVSLLLGIALTVADASVSRARSFGIGLGLVAAAVLVGAAVPTWSATLMSSGVYWNLPRYIAGYDEAGIAGVEARMPKGRTLYHREGLTATVVVEQDPNGDRSLTINGRTESGDLFMRTQVLIAHWPVWLAPRADRILVIGFGSGATAGSVLRHPVRRLDVVELEAAVIEASRLFEPENGRPLADPRTRVAAADGRNFLLLTSDRYDVIISQPSLPWVAGAATLFTQEFFDIAAAHLAPGGVFGQWVDAGAMGRGQLQSVLAAFALVFPHFLVVEPTPGDLFLIGSLSPLALDPRRIGASFADPSIATDLQRVDIGTPENLYETFLGDEVTVKPLLAGAIPNRDENVYVEFSGPIAFAGILSGRRGEGLAWIQRDQAARTWNALLARGIE